MSRQPKKYINILRHRDKIYGNELRASYSKEIMKDEPYFPKPLTYEDIDKAMFEFVDSLVDIVSDGVKIPTFMLYSNQRFSEYSQTWKHTDENGNLLLNFKTISRENDPKNGENQGGLWNIPGDRYYTMRIRTVLDDNGTESYEIYSMKQPFCIDMMYRICFVTDKYSMLNVFNEKVNKLFSARQYYIRPNGHYIPMIIDSVNDESTYSNDERKFFMQSFNIKAMAYIINENDFKVEKKPKRIMLFSEGDTFKPKPLVSIDEYDDIYENKTLELTVDFKEYHDKAEFDIDTDMIIEKINMTNIRKVRVFVNDTMYYVDKGFSVKNGDNIKIKIRQFDEGNKSCIKFIGYDPSSVYKKDYIPENVSDEAVKHEEIVIE
jgi:hypothetical protein